MMDGREGSRGGWDLRDDEGVGLAERLIAHTMRMRSYISTICRLGRRLG